MSGGLNSRTNPPSRSAILYNVAKFENTGTVNHVPREIPKMTKKCQRVKIEIKPLVTETPSLSKNKLVASTQMSTSSSRRILVNELHLKPYI